MMIRCVLLAASFLSAAPAYWTQKSVGSNPVAPFTLARTDTIIARQVHDTADVLRKYTRDRIKDSLVGIRAALPAYVRRIGDTITGPIVGTTATAAPLINITTTFGNLTNAAIRGTASAEGGAAIHGIATGMNGAAIWGVSTNTGGDGGLFSGKGGANAVRAIATGGGKAGIFRGDVEVVGTTTLASSLTGILKANAGVVSVADTSDFPTRPYLPLAAGSGSPLTGVLYGQGLNFTTTADAPVTISHNLAGAFTHPFQAFNSGMVAGNQYNFDFGQSASTNNAGNFGFKYVGAGSSSNYVTLGLYGANDLMTITAAGVPKFSGLATVGFVRANASGQLSSSPPTYADLTGTVPTWNQNTTGSAAKWATPRTLTIGATGKAIDGTGNQSWSLAEIGAQAAGAYLTPSNVSGAAGQIAFFRSANAVGGSSRAKYAESASSTSIDLIGGTVQSEITMVPPGTRMTHIYAASGGAGFKETDLDGTSSPNWPIAWAPGAGGMLELGRPTTMASKLYFADNAGAYIIGGRNSAADPYFYITSINAPTAGIRLLTSNAGTEIVALSAEANGSVALPNLAGATTRIATISATGQIGAASTFPLTGVTDGSSASSGIVGEIISASASGTSFTGTTAGVSLVSISLPAGSWLVWGSAKITNGASPLALSVYLSYSPTGTTLINANTSFTLGYPVANSGITCHNAPTPINSSSTATVYLIGSEVTTGSVAVNTGATIYAQRIR